MRCLLPLTDFAHLLQPASHVLPAPRYCRAHTPAFSSGLVRQRVPLPQPAHTGQTVSADRPAAHLGRPPWVASKLGPDHAAGGLLCPDAGVPPAAGGDADVVQQPLTDGQVLFIRVRQRGPWRRRALRASLRLSLGADCTGGRNRGRSWRLVSLVSTVWALLTPSMWGQGGMHAASCTPTARARCCMMGSAGTCSRCPGAAVACGAGPEAGGLDCEAGGCVPAAVLPASGGAGVCACALGPLLAAWCCRCSCSSSCW